MVTAKFTYFFDVKTAKDVITKIDVVYGGKYPQSAFIDYFTRFKYFKPVNVKINVKPCATLPVDPSGLSYTEGEQTVDPRDIFSLGMCRITNGENIPDIPSMSADEAHKFYNNMLMDKRWYKFSPHKGLVKSAVPKMWSVAESWQDKFPGSVTTTPLINYGGTQGGVPIGVGSESSVRYNYGKLGSSGQWGINNSDTKDVQLRYGTNFNKGRLLQNGLEPVRWMPCDEYVKVRNVASDTAEGNTLSLVNFEVFTIATPPEATIMTLLFPPQVKTFNFFRIWVTETFAFKGYVSNVNIPQLWSSDTVNVTASIDRYIRPNAQIIQADPTLANNRFIEPKLR